MIPEDPDYEQAKDALHNACIPQADELWFFTDRVCVVYVRSVSVSPVRRYEQSDEENLFIYVYEQIGRPNTGSRYAFTGGRYAFTGGGYSFIYRHYPMSTWRFLWVAGTLRRITEKQALHFVGADSLRAMRQRTEELRRHALDDVLW